MVVINLQKDQVIVVNAVVIQVLEKIVLRKIHPRMSVGDVVHL